MNKRPSERHLGCNYQGHEFGAHYPDSVCIDGYLWDADSGDSEGLTYGGDLPCPQCNHREYRDYHADSIRDDAWVAVSKRAWPFRRAAHKQDRIWAHWLQLCGVCAFAWDFIRGRT